ncbi:MAG: AAA family ATPase, partial [Anaerolineales bacterium]|nr:AAA family ATPase [Anaerolineales bacterium]
MLDHSSFIGRQKEYDDIQQLLTQADCRLLTLVGPGGIGKTRLARRLGALLGADYARGASVVLLQPLRSSEFFVSAVADALGIALTGSEPPLDQLVHYLSDKEALIILDNFEHLLDATAQLTTLLAATPQVKYLVTSREALNMREEWLYPLAGLSFPNGLNGDTTDQTADAVQLFFERAQRVYPNFALETELEAIVHICQLVGGMPLALELAAAWRKTLNCQEIAAEIQGGLDFLTTRLRNATERHHSMVTVFDQTWQRLSPREQNAFKRLSVFRGGFLRDAAGAVAGASLPVLSALVDKSLLQLHVDGRYQIHELLRQYAAEQLGNDAGEVAQTQADHASFYIRFLDERREDVGGRRQRESLHEIRGDLDNIRAAWLWAVAQGDAPSLQKASTPLGLYYQFLGGYAEGLSLYSQAMALLLSQPINEAADRAMLTIRMYEGWYHLRFGRPADTEACMAHIKAIYQRLDIPYIVDYVTDPRIPLCFVALTRG